MNRLTYSVFLSECQKSEVYEQNSKECCFTGAVQVLLVSRTSVVREPYKCCSQAV